MLSSSCSHDVPPTINSIPQANAHRLAPDSLAASVVILLVVNIVQRSVGFGRGILFCRWLSPEELGQWDMAYSFLLLAAPLVVLGLPGSFGRYLERYRQRQQLRTFLRRATIWTAALTAAAVAMIAICDAEFSGLDLRPARSQDTRDANRGQPGGRDPAPFSGSAVRRAAEVPHRLDDALLPEHGVRGDFAEPAVVVASCRPRASSSATERPAWFRRSATLLWTGRSIAEVAAPGRGVAHREFWPPLVRFAFWVWVINLFCHLFAVVDRYMLVHCSGLDNDDALAHVGHYHASRIVPLLFLSVADLLAGVVMPYLSHDWEAASARAGLGPAQSGSQAHVARHARRRRAVLLWRAAVVPRRVRRPVRRRPGRDAVDAHLLRLVRAAARGPELHLVRGEDEARRAAARRRPGGEHRDSTCADSGLGLLGAVFATTVATGSRWPCCTGSTAGGHAAAERHASGCRSPRSRCAAACGAARLCSWPADRRTIFEDARSRHERARDDRQLPASSISGQTESAVLC